MGAKIGPISDQGAQINHFLGLSTRDPGPEGFIKDKISKDNKIINKKHQFPDKLFVPLVTTSEKVLDTNLLPKISIKTLKIVFVETDENADENLVEDESVGEKINTKGLESSAKEITLTKRKLLFVGR